MPCMYVYMQCIFIHVSYAPILLSTIYSPLLLMYGIWVEINKRVNYPIKNALISMENEGLIATECQRDPVDCFCVSWVTLQVAHEGVQLAIAAWNSHSVPGSFA